MKNLPIPLNSEERYWHGICERLDQIIELLTPSEPLKKEEELPGQMTIDEVAVEKVESIDYSSYTKFQLMELLNERGVDYNSRDKKSVLLKLAKDTE